MSASFLFGILLCDINTVYILYLIPISFFSTYTYFFFYLIAINTHLLVIDLAKLNPIGIWLQSKYIHTLMKY